MKTIVIIAVLAVGLVIGYKKLDAKTFERNSRQRVEMMFERMKTGNLADEQEAIGYWHVGHPEPASDYTANMFSKFRGQKSLGAIESFSVISTTLDGGDGTGRFCDVVCDVNGKELTIRVRLVRPLEWADLSS